MASKEKSPESRAHGQYYCDFCRTDITNVARIRCAECEDFDLCLHCFSHGVECYMHRNNHKYHVVDHVTTPVFESDWGADEELLLLEAIEMYGLGNWSDVADHVAPDLKSGKTAKTCESHYYRVYLNSPCTPLPLPVAPSSREAKAKAVTEAAKAPTKKTKKSVDKKKQGLGPLVGYMPKRGDFETEYANDAEEMLKDLEFKEEDTPEERELKLKVLEIYESRLDQRAMRKQFIRERGLLNFREQKRSPEEREIEEQMAPFARFQSPQEHEQFINGLVRERQLRRRIAQLQSYRMMGIRTLTEATEFEAERRRQAVAQGRTPPPALAFDACKRERAATGAEPSAKRQKTGGMDVSRLEGAELLSPMERELCSQLSLIPRHFMVIKDTLIRESYSRGFLQKDKSNQLLKIDANKMEKAIDFFVSVGWVNEKTGPPPPRIEGR